MTLSTQLWSENSDLASEALTHPFVCRLGDGSLAREIFAGYVAQDAFFLESFARAYALALAHSPDTPTLLALADLLAGVNPPAAKDRARVTSIAHQILARLIATPG